MAIVVDTYLVRRSHGGSTSTLFFFSEKTQKTKKMTNEDEKLKR